MEIELNMNCCVQTDGILLGPHHMLDKIYQWGEMNIKWKNDDRRNKRVDKIMGGRVGSKYGV